MNIQIRLCSCVLLATSALSAQQPAAKSLGKPDGEFKAPFTDITSIRELRDGRVIVADRRDRIVQRFGNGTVYLSRKDDDDLAYLQRYQMPK